MVCAYTFKFSEHCDIWFRPLIFSSFETTLCLSSSGKCKMPRPGHFSVYSINLPFRVCYILPGQAQLLSLLSLLKNKCLQSLLVVEGREAVPMCSPSQPCLSGLLLLMKPLRYAYSGAWRGVTLGLSSISIGRKTVVELCYAKPRSCCWHTLQYLRKQKPPPPPTTNQNMHSYFSA